MRSVKICMTKQSHSVGHTLSFTGHIHTEHYCPCPHRSHTKQHYCPCLVGVCDWSSGYTRAQGVNGLAGTDPMPVKEVLRSKRFKSVKLSP